MKLILPPNRPIPKDKWNLEERHQDILNIFVTSGIDKVTAYRMTLPNYQWNGTALKLKSNADEFFAHPEVLRYLNAYEETVYRHYNPDKEQSKVITDEDRIKRKEATLNKIYDRLDEKVMAGTADVQEIKLMLDKFFEDVENDIQPPIRYLPVSCESECLYRKWIEENAEPQCPKCVAYRICELLKIEIKSETQLSDKEFERSAEAVSRRLKN